jgi:hypothetical protein
VAIPSQVTPQISRTAYGVHVSDAAEIPLDSVSWALIVNRAMTIVTTSFLRTSAAALAGWGQFGIEIEATTRVSVRTSG